MFILPIKYIIKLAKNIKLLAHYAKGTLLHFKNALIDII